jgi:hypothetical protein
MRQPRRSEAGRDTSYALPHTPEAGGQAAKETMLA